MNTTWTAVPALTTTERDAKIATAMQLVNEAAALLKAVHASNCLAKTSRSELTAESAEAFAASALASDVTATAARVLFAKYGKRAATS